MLDKRGSRKPTKQKTRRRRSSRDLLWYDALLQSGVMALGNDQYSLSLRLSDINYQMATPARQQEQLERYARFLHGFGADERLQVTIINRRVPKDGLLRKVLLSEPRYGDDMTMYRNDHNEIIRKKIAEGAQWARVSEKYLTVTTSAGSLEHAKKALHGIANRVMSEMWSLLECRAEVLTGEERIELLREQTRGCHEKGFDYRALALSGGMTLDELAPSAVDMRNPRRIEIVGDEGQMFVETLVMRDYPVWLSDRLFTKLAELPGDLTMSFHMTPIEQAESRELVLRRKIALDIERSATRRKVRKAGMDPVEDLPHELVRASEEVRELLGEIEKSDQRLFTTTLVVMARAETTEELEDLVKQVRVVAKGQSCVLAGLSCFQQPALNTALPLGRSWVPIHRTLTTAATAVMVPFTSQEILDDGGLFYGVNAATSNPIIADRRQTRNGNAFILGTSGSGKSFFGKREMTQVLLGREDDVIIIDPEHEYRPLADVFGASVIEVHAGSEAVINPFDIVVSNVEGDPVRLKAESLLGMLRVLLGGSKGLSASEEAILDRVITTLYGRYLGGDPGQPVPTLRDLHAELLRQAEAEAGSLAVALELYAKGTFSGFAQQTNVDTDRRFVYYDMSKLGDHMKTFGMMVVLDQVWQRVMRNFGRNVRTWLYVDEFHLMLTNPYAVKSFLAIYKRARKYGLLPTGITQNVEEVLDVPEARLMLSNCDVLFLLGQQKSDADALAELLDLSEEEIRAFTSVEAGCGLLRFGGTTLAFDGRMPTTGPLADLFNTTFDA